MLRGDAGFSREKLMRWCESQGVDVLLQTLRRMGLAGTEMEKAQCGTIRLKLLKIGAQIRITVRRVWVSLAGGYPYAALFARVDANLEAAGSPG